jgi:PTH1 family peptidyl-tRNA hydrolase
MKFDKNILLVVGLGNPGKDFDFTPHNVGFLILDKIKKEYNFPDFIFLKEANSLVSSGKILEKKLILAKPQTFMNNSGFAVKSLMKNYNLSENNLLVIHDDFDLPFGKMRISKNRSDGGHKGVKSIINEISTKNFVRIRIGFQPENGKPKNLEKLVLKKISKQKINNLAKKAFEIFDFLLKEGLEKTMSKYN